MDAWIKENAPLALEWEENAPLVLESWNSVDSKICSDIIGNALNEDHIGLDLQAVQSIFGFVRRGTYILATQRRYRCRGIMETTEE